MNAAGRRRAVFLDRDGVINAAVVSDGVPHPPTGVSELVILPGVAEACGRLRNAGYVLVVVTNQPDVARGTTSMATVEALNAEISRRVPLDHFYVCPHDDRDGCGCRKPAPGLLKAAADDHGLDLGTSFVVGDRWRDIDAGLAAGCRTIHVDRGYIERPAVRADIVVGDLVAGADWILGAASADMTMETESA